MKDKIFGVLQRVGRSFMLPIAILPVAGLLLGFGGSFTNETMLETYGLLNVMGPGTIPYAIFQVMSEAGNIVFANLPIIFAMGVAIGMAKKEKEVAALSAAIAFFIMHASISAMITINGGTENMLEGATTSVVGITSLQMGVFGGIRLCRNMGIWFPRKTITSIRSSSRILPSILADCTWWNNGSRRHSHRRCTEHLLCTAR